MRTSLPALVLLSMLATTSLAACGGGSSDPAPTTTPGAGTTPPPAGNSGGGSVEVTIAGGPDAGDYKADGVYTGCSVGLAGENAFGVQFSDDSVTEGLSSVQAIVNAPDDFLATATIGPFLADGTQYDVVEGTAEVDPSEALPTLVVNGTTADGIEVMIKVSCDGVL